MSKTKRSKEQSNLYLSVDKDLFDEVESIGSFEDDLEEKKRRLTVVQIKASLRERKSAYVLSMASFVISLVVFMLVVIQFLILIFQFVLDVGVVGKVTKISMMGATLLVVVIGGFGIKKITDAYDSNKDAQ